MENNAPQKSLKERNALAARQYYGRNKDRRKLEMLEYQKSNPHIFAKNTAKRRARRKEATPKWVNIDKVNAIYAMSKWLSDVVPGVKYHVDHKIPLHGKLVCGLHVESNLQILHAKANQKKHRNFEVM